METQRFGVPTGTVVAATYGSGIAPVGSSLALVPSGARLVQSGPDEEWVPPFEPDPKHCSHVVDEVQCRSWPMKTDPDRLCVGHRKQKDNSGPDPGSDSDVRPLSP